MLAKYRMIDDLSQALIVTRSLACCTGGHDVQHNCKGSNPLRLGDSFFAKSSDFRNERPRLRFGHLRLPYGTPDLPEVKDRSRDEYSQCYHRSAEPFQIPLPIISPLSVTPIGRKLGRVHSVISTPRRIVAEALWTTIGLVALRQQEFLIVLRIIGVV